MQGHGRIIAPDFYVAHREANSGLSTLNRTKTILSIYHQQRQLQKQRGMCLNDTYPFCQQPLSGNCHSICFSKPVLWTATPWAVFFYGASAPRRECGVRRREPLCGATGVYSIKRPRCAVRSGGGKKPPRWGRFSFCLTRLLQSGRFFAVFPQIPWALREKIISDTAPALPCGRSAPR